ncbi:Aldose reductase A [Diplonema papillatum]|nr:Aldose reductase A [Diplonema papillatum]|eukprot:gene8474-13073_t
MSAPKFVELKGTGQKMPTVGLGTWLSEEGKVYKAVKAAIGSGYRHIDCAWIYFNEDEVGKGLKEVFEEGTVKREEVFVTSKLWNSYHRPELVKKGLQDSLDKLGLKYLDLYLMHFPVSFKPGVDEATSKDQLEDVPIEETWKAMEALVDEGLVKNIGISNYEIPDVEKLLKVAVKPIAVNQFETQPYFPRTELVEFCQKNGIMVTAHTSLGSPSNVMSTYHKSPPLMQDETINRISKEIGQSPAHVLLRWGLQRGTAVIPKSVTPARIATNFDLFSFELSEAQMKAINDLKKPGLDGCFNHPKTPWLGRSEFVEGQTSHYCN